MELKVDSCDSELEGCIFIKIFNFSNLFQSSSAEGAIESSHGVKLWNSPLGRHTSTDTVLCPKSKDKTRKPECVTPGLWGLV